jgi:hypothetical protein
MKTKISGWNIIKCIHPTVITEIPHDRPPRRVTPPAYPPTLLPGVSTAAGPSLLGGISRHHRNDEEDGQFLS